MKTAFLPIVYPDSQILILGTMPGEKSLQKQEYYGNRGNHFWKLLFTIYNDPFSEDYAIRKDLLFRKKIALWDVLSGCEREGSLDSKIKNEVANDFESFFNEYPNIQHVYFSSKAALVYYQKSALTRDYIQYYVLPSPSGANASMTFLQKLEIWKIILVNKSKFQLRS